MGKEVVNKGYTEAEIIEFRRRLEEETAIVKNWFDTQAFQHNEQKTGIELEAWLVNENMLPDPFNETFLDELNLDQVVPEIAKFNFELNSNPYKLKGKAFSLLEKELNHLWKTCENKAQEHDKHALLIGTLPTLRPHMLDMEFLSAKNRYAVMNEQVMKMREGKPLYIRLEGKDNLYMYMDSVIAECAATSLQIHLSIDQSKAKRYYNASMLAAPYLIALSANSPYFFGRELWDESRIAIFEQAVDLHSTNRSGKDIKRVTLGNGYIKESLFELYEENTADYPILLAELEEDYDPTKLSHIQLHNGTIWRWNRPIISKGKDGRPHLRIEQRVPSAGPTIVDSVANAAFAIGLVDYLANLEVIPEDIISFDEAVHNFYKASRQSFFCKVRWIDGKLHDMRDLLLYEIFPHVKQSLLKRGLDEEDVDYYMEQIIHPRLQKGVNGTIWQKAFIHMHGKRFQELLESYVKNQYSGKPVHSWEL
jgi:hypothetical protein